MDTPNQSTAKRALLVVERAEQLEREPARKGHPGRPPSPTEAVAKSIYFRDRSQVQELEKVLEPFPKASVSGVAQQLLGQFTEAMQSDPQVRSTRKITVTCEVFL